MNLEMVKVAHHKNGIGGESFYVVLFRDLDAEPYTGLAIPVTPLMAGVVFDQPDETGGVITTGRVAVLDVQQTLEHNIEFAQGNSWRGDTYEATLRAMVQAYEEDRGAAGPTIHPMFVGNVLVSVSLPRHPLAVPPEADLCDNPAHHPTDDGPDFLAIGDPDCPDCRKRSADATELPTA